MLQAIGSYPQDIGTRAARRAVHLPDVMQKGSDGAPRTYEILKEKGSANGFAMIDNSPGSANPAASSKTTPAFSRQLYPNLLTLDEMEAVEARHEDEMFARISARRMAKNTPE